MDLTCPSRNNTSDPLSLFISEFNNLIFNVQIDLLTIKNCKIRLHTKNLDGTGDLNFPFRLQQWQEWLQKLIPQSEMCKNYELPESATVFDVATTGDGIGKYLFNSLLKLSSVEEWNFRVKKICIFKHHMYFYLDRVSLMPKIINYVLSQNPKFCRSVIDNYKIVYNEILQEKQLSDISLIELRILFLELFTSKLFKALNDPSKQQKEISWTTKLSEKNKMVLICGPVIGQDGLKNRQTSAEQLLNKRANDMRLIAEHRYKMKVDTSSNWREYFHKLGRGAVAVHMLQQKPHKEIKISIYDISTTHKGPEFIFYNCARLGNLLKQHQRKVEDGIYPVLPPIEEVDFSLLNQPEEWQLFYVYIVQFPLVVKSTLTIDKKTENCEILPHYLITFLSNLACTFSSYYGRIKILTEPREYVFPTLHARIYLLRALQIVFHDALDFLDIEPIQQM